MGYGQHRIIDIYTQLYIYIRLLQFTACRVYPASRSLSGEETHELSTQLRRISHHLSLIEAPFFEAVAHELGVGGLETGARKVE